MTKELTKSEQALFDAKVALCRIDGAWRFIQEVQRPNWERLQIVNGGWFVLMKNQFFETVKSYLREMPFSAVEYDSVYSLSHSKRYKEMVVVREANLKSDIWDYFEDFMVMMVQQRDGGKWLSYASKGFDFVQMNPAPGTWIHDCDKLPVLYEAVGLAEFKARADERHRKEMHHISGKWECDQCGFRVLVVNIQLDRLFDLHQKVMKGGK